jgi:adenylate cyclase
MLYKLIAAEGDQAFELRGGSTLVVGRALNSDIPVFDPTISRRHAEVTCDAGGVRVRDLGSSNGTFINGMKVEAATTVAPGDIVTFGKVAFRLKENAPTPAAPHAVSTPVDAPGPKGSATIVRQLPASPSVANFATGMAPPLPVLDNEAANEAARFAMEMARTQDRLKKLLETATALTGAAGVDSLLEKVADKVFDVLDVDRVSILLMGEQGELQPKVTRDKRGAVETRVVPTSIARTAVQDRVAILSDNAGEDQRFGGQSILMQRVRSAICVPLIGSEERVLGVLYVDNLTTTHRFSDDDLEFLIAFSGIAAAAVENSQFAERIRRELQVRANFQRYFAPKLAERIASSPEAARLGGDKRPVAVLFSDIRGFTALSETMRPDDMASLLTEYFTEMVEIVFRNGGTLDKFIGDAVMAQWGAPLGAEDDPDMAMKAAIEMIYALDQLNEKWVAEGRPQLQIGIGLNHGEAFAGNIGSEQRLEFTVIGDSVNTASRLCGAAGAREILISEQMRAALHSEPPLEPREPMALKGKSQVVPVYSVVL